MNSAHEHADTAPRSQRSKGRRVASWREHHGWSAAASLRRLASRPFGTLLTVSVMGLALALPLAFYLLLVNVQSLGDSMGRAPSISVFLKVGQPASVAQLMAGELRGYDEVASVAVRTPQQGMRELATMQGFSGALDVLGDNPLPYVLQVQPRAGLDAAALDRLITGVRSRSTVDVVQDAGHWRQRLDALLALGNRVALVLASILALAALLVVGNTVRVDIASRQEEIGVLLLVGASRAFVRRPYLYAGIWYGLFGGVLAALLAVAVEWSLAVPVQQLTAAYEGALHLDGLPLWLLLSVPLATAALGWLGARLVSAWQLRKAFESAQ